MKRYQRINIVGTSGSGKSTLAKKVSNSSPLPYIEMDQIFWRPNWQGTPDEEFQLKIRKALTEESWVLDGNYSRTEPIKWERVEAVIWVDLPFLITVFQAVKRAIIRAFKKEELWPNTGNRESFKNSFLNRDSIILWTLKTYHKKAKRYENQMKDPQLSHIDFIRLRSRKEVDKFVEQFQQVWSKDS